MKILVMAQTPPPMHGQSSMVQLFLDTISEPGMEPKIEVIHLNFKFSGEIGEIGLFQIKKCFSLIYYLCKMVWIRFKYVPDLFYYVPAPAQRIPLFRDYFTLLLARQIYPRVIFHWHSVGVGQWSQHRAKQGVGGRLDQLLCNACYGMADLSIVLSELTRPDAEVFRPKNMAVIHNGIPDPCLHFDETLLPQRLRRHLKIKTKLDSSFGKNEKLTLRFLFMALCTKQKGLFDALRSLEILERSLSLSEKNISIQFDVAGIFPDHKIKEKFLQHVYQQEHITVKLHGFVSGRIKHLLLQNSDGMVYPSYYENEGFPLILIEALAYGLPVVASRWRGIPELLGNDYPFLEMPNKPDAMAKKLHIILEETNYSKLRQRYEKHFTEVVFKLKILKILQSIAGNK